MAIRAPFEQPKPPNPPTLTKNRFTVTTVTLYLANINEYYLTATHPSALCDK